MGKYIKLKALDNASLSGDQDLHFFCKYIENADPDLLQTDVNTWLLSLEAVPDIQFAFLSSQYATHGSGAGFRHTAWLSMAAIGDVPTP